ncbi:unnamed protein product [Orchesella dallaii]|uniref:Uncharacterized protein n=1 Tax=Orchesella dallaii TaxID=48710 RepID=A0ABP1QYJ1_9HEXA
MEPINIVLTIILRGFAYLLGTIGLMGILINQPYPHQPGSNLNDDYNRDAFVLHILSKLLQKCLEDEYEDCEPDAIDYDLYRAWVTCWHFTDEMFAVRRKGVMVKKPSPRLKQGKTVAGHRGNLNQPRVLQQCLHTVNNSVLYQLKPANQRRTREPTYRFHSRT